MNTRVIAHLIINKVIQDHCSLKTAFSHWITPNLNAQEIAFIKECSFGVLRWFHQLDYIKSILLHSPLKNKDYDIDHLILLGLFQILYTHVPNHAAVSETTSVCKTLKKNWATGLVNKCLRRFIQEKEQIMACIQNNHEAHFSHPNWLIDKIKKDWPKQWQTILEANNEKPPLWLRVNVQKTTQSHYLNILDQNSITAFAANDLNTGIQLAPPIPTHQIPHFNEGYTSIQDLSGQFAIPFLNLKKGVRVLDACAAPGSKTSHILESEPKLAKLVIIDKDPQRFQMIKENIVRLGLDSQCIQPILSDATHTQQWWDGIPFDRILLDTPCSSTGVIRRHPDIKLLRKSEDIHAITQVQKQLLTTLWKLLKKNGKLLYSTCSILSEENEKVISSFLTQHKNAKVEKITLPMAIKKRYGVQLLPRNQGPDGFYYALLSKK